MSPPEVLLPLVPVAIFDAFQAGMLSDDDLAELREQIHQLLGIAGVFKLATLEQLVRHLHEQIKAGSLTSVSALLDKIDREVEWIDL